MKCIIVYGTLSGSTSTAADLVAAGLKAHGHDVTSISADGATKESVGANNVLIIGSPSWEDEGKDGQPLPEIRVFLESLTTEALANKKVAIFGLGDTSYQHFCGAVDVMQEKLKTLGVVPVVESLRIDRYYSSPDNQKKVQDWAENLASKIG